MARFGVLIDNVNTGKDDELAVVFAAPMSIINNAPATISDVASLKRVVTSQKVQRWEIESAVVPTNDSFEYASSIFINNHNLSIYVRMPQIFRMGFYDSNTEFNAATMTTGGAQSKGASSVTTSGGSMHTGEFFRFDGHSKVYYCKASSAGGISFYPELVADVTGGENIFHGAHCTMRAKYDNSGTSGITFSDGVLLDPGTIRLIEDLT